MWTYLPKQKKIDSVVREVSRFILFIFAIIILHLVFILFNMKEHEITDRFYITVLNKSLYLYIY